MNSVLLEDGQVIEVNKIHTDDWEAGQFETCIKCNRPLRYYIILNGSTYGLSCAAKELGLVKEHASPRAVSSAVVQLIQDIEYAKLQYAESLKRKDYINSQEFVKRPAKPELVHANQISIIRSFENALCLGSGSKKIDKQVNALIVWGILEANKDRTVIRISEAGVNLLEKIDTMDIFSAYVYFLGREKFNPIF